MKRSLAFLFSLHHKLLPVTRTFFSLDIQGGPPHIAIQIYVIIITRSEKCFSDEVELLSSGAYFDDTSFLIGGCVENV